MARWQPMQLVGGAYADDALPWSHQDTVNYIPVPAEKGGARSKSILRCAPGLVPMTLLGTNAPIRGMRNVEGRLFVVSAQSLFSIGVDGSATSLGTIPGVQRCSLSHNQIAGGNEVAISNGQSGYVYNTKTGTLVQVTDEGFPGAISFDFVDGYILSIEPARRFAFTSDLAAATSYNTLDRYEAEGSPDLLVGQAVTHREWWLMGERTIEPFVNTGASTGTFQRSQGTVIEVGLAATHAVAVMDNSVFWLGNDGIVYRANGYTPQRISTHAIEQAISRCNTGQAFAFTFEDNGHKVFYLTFPDGHTWGYDAATGEWHRRASYGIDRWRINCLVKWRGKWVAGDYSNGMLYQLDWNTQSEYDKKMERRRVTGVTHDNQNALIIDGIELVIDTGLPASSGDLLVPSVKVSGDLSNGPAGEVVSYQYSVEGGVQPNTVSVASGSLPAGLSMNSSGLVTGTRTTLGDYAWTVRATDALGATSDLSDASVTWKPEALNPSDKVGVGATVSNSNRTISTTSANSYAVVRAVDAYSSGKFYYEAVFAKSGSLFNESVGINLLTGLVPSNGPGTGIATGVNDNNGYGYVQSGKIVNRSVYTNYGSGFVGNDVVMVAVDLDAGKLWFGKNGAWQASGDPANGLSPSSTIVAGSYAPCLNAYELGVSGTCNFVTSDFAYTPPAGFKPWGEP